MKILVVCQYYYPEEFQINDICKELVKQGNQVSVLTGLPNYPTGIIPENYQHGQRREEIIEGVKVIRCWEIPRKKGMVRLGLNYLSFTLASSFKVLFSKHDFDVIYVHQYSPIFMAMPGLILKYLSRKKLFLYCCDLWPESLKVMHIQENSLIFKIVKVLSKTIYQHCDKIGIQAPAFFAYFERVIGIPHERLVYIPQFASSEYLDSDYNSKHDGINLVFLGNIGLVQDLECVVQAVKINARDNLKYKVHIVGDGSFLETLKKLVQENDLQEYFIFYGRRPVSEMGKFYRLADACLLTLKGDSFVGQTIPGKLQGYMAAGKTVIAAINGSAQTVIKEAKCGLVGNAGDYKVLAKNIEAMVKNPDDYKNCGANGRLYFKKYFTKERYINSISEIFNRYVV